MDHHALSDDLRALLERGVPGSAQHAALEQACLAAHDEQGLSSVLKTVNVGAFSGLALLLKQDWEAHDERRGPWQPWTRLDHWSRVLAAYGSSLAGERLQVLLLEQWGLGCHHLPLRMLPWLEQRHFQSEAMLDGAPPELQSQFLAAKKLWLQREFELQQLADLHAQSMREIERTRVQYLQMYREPHEALLSAAELLALWRYRERFDDISLTELEMRERLAVDLDTENVTGSLEFEAALRTALQESVGGLRADLASIQEMRELLASGRATPATAEETARAVELYRKLARRIHPDALRHHPQAYSISDENRRRLHDIWCAATATHRRRGCLERRRLLDFTRNLEAWDREVAQILQHVEFHDPGRIVAGDSLEGQWDYVRASLAEATHHLHAIRDDVAQLAADPVCRRQRELVALSDPLQQRERERMRGQAALWEREAREIEQRMSQRSAAAAAADRALLRKASP